METGDKILLFCFFFKITCGPYLTLGRPQYLNT